MVSTLVDLTDNSLEVLKQRYLKKDDKGNVIEAPEDMFRRVANFLSQAEYIYEQEGSKTDRKAEEAERDFFEVMCSLEFLPNSPTLMNAGRELGQLSGCFVLPVPDSIEGIFEAVKQTAIIHQSGGGTGFSFSGIRPRGSLVGTYAGLASGPVSFMSAFDSATHVVKQGGTRRGANMGVLHYTHPDIKEFIQQKLDGVTLQNFNISVTVDKRFMEGVRDDLSYSLIDTQTREHVSTVGCREIFDLIVECAYKTGDPGLIFIDKVNDDNWNKHLGEIESTNPCGEQPLMPYESCNLGSINLSKFVEKDDLNWDRLAEVCKIAVRMMDNVIDMNKYPLPEIEAMTKNTRRIGLGVMGFADMLVRLGVRYDSEEGLEWGSQVMDFVRGQIWLASKDLSKTRGVYPGFSHESDGPYDEFRNTSPTTIAPTGTISIIAGCSSGIEPLFALAYTRDVMDGTKLTEMNELLREAHLGNLYWETDWKTDLPVIEELAKGKNFSDNESLFDNVPDSIKRVFRTSHEISPEWHIKMQSAFQEHTDNAVSKTINMPNSATQQDIADCYMYAWETNCKGITVYRDRSKETQVLNLGTAIPNLIDTPQVVPSINGSKNLETKETRVGHPYIDRPHTLYGVTPKINTGHGTLYQTINMYEEGKIREIFINLGKVGDCTSAFTEAIARLLSTALSCGVDPEVLANQLVGLSCKHTAFNNGDIITSIPDAVGKAMLEVLGKETFTSKGNLCPDCSNPLDPIKCPTCSHCGFSECL